nr:unnamed protein product [Spirometra erinaceieuropaei]
MLYTGTTASNEPEISTDEVEVCQTVFNKLVKAVEAGEASKAVDIIDATCEKLTGKERKVSLYSPLVYLIVVHPHLTRSFYIVCRYSPN